MDIFLVWLSVTSDKLTGDPPPLSLPPLVFYFTLTFSPYLFWYFDFVTHFFASSFATVFVASSFNVHFIIFLPCQRCQFLTPLAALSTCIIFSISLFATARLSLPTPSSTCAIFLTSRWHGIPNSGAPCYNKIALLQVTNWRIERWIKFQNRTKIILKLL